MKKRVLSILLCLCMASTLLPTAAFAVEVEAPATSVVEEPATLATDYDGWDTAIAYQSGEQITVEQLITMIDALPNADEITDENLETATADFEAVWNAYEALFEDETIENLDGQLGAERMQKLAALREVLLDMVNLAGEVYGLLKDDTGTVYATNSDGTQTDGGSIANNTVTYLFVGSNVAKIEMSAFEDSTSLTAVDLSDATALTQISQAAFIRCTNLTTIDLSKATALQTISAQAFAQTGITSITIPESVTRIGDSAFDTCTSLTEVNLPNAEKLGTIGNRAFFGCTKLTNVDLSSAISLETIGEQAFQGTGITSITIPASVTKIGAMAFSGTGITEITIPASVTDIGMWAFSNCTNLNTATFRGTTPPTIGTNVFAKSTALEKIYVPNGSVEAYKAAENLTAYADKIVGYKLETEFTGGVTTDKNEYTYGDTITVTVTPTATDTLVPQTLNLTPPVAEQVALFVGETQITEPQPAPIGTELTFTVGTNDTALKNGKNTITAKYIGGANSTDCVGTVTVILNGLPIDFTSGDHSTATLEDNGYTWTGNETDGYTLTLGNLNLTAQMPITLPDADVEIVLAGKTTLTAEQAGIYSDGTEEAYGAHTVTISGDGSLAISKGHYGISVVQNLSITGGTLDMKGDSGSIIADGDIEISGGKITGNRIWAGKALTISGDTVDVNVEQTDGPAIQANENITISGGTVNAVSNIIGISANGGSITISNSTVNATGTNGYGILSNGGTLMISNSTVNAKGDLSAIWSRAGITLTGMRITKPAGAVVGDVEGGKAILLNGKDVKDVTIEKYTAPSGGGGSTDDDSSGDSTTTYYTITTSAGAGGFFSTGTTVKVPAGDSAGFTITPNKGYAIADVLVDGKSVGAVSSYVFTNVTANHTISATFKKSDHVNPQTGVEIDFTDVTVKDWFYEDVMTVYENGWFVGISNTTLSPYASMTRSMIVTMLYRMEASSAVETSGTKWYAKGRA